jgi:hypothetical protein
VLEDEHERGRAEVVDDRGLDRRDVLVVGRRRLGDDPGRDPRGLLVPGLERVRLAFLDRALDDLAVDLGGDLLADEVGVRAITTRSICCRARSARAALSSVVTPLIVIQADTRDWYALGSAGRPELVGTTSSVSSGRRVPL